MANTSIDLAKKLFEYVSTLEEFVNENGLVTNSQDEKFVKFTQKIIVAHDASKRAPKMGVKSEHFSDLLMQFVQTARRRDNDNVVTVGLGSRSENTPGLVKSGYDVSIPLLADHTNLSALTGPNWQQFHQLVGDAFFWYFLKNMTVFESKERGPLIQILGKPVWDVMKEMTPDQLFLKRSSSKSRPSNDAKDLQKSGRRKRARSSTSDTEPRTKRARIDAPIRSETPSMSERKKSSAISEAGATEPRIKKRKRSRRNAKKKSKPKDSETDEGEAYHYRLPIIHTVYLHAKNHRERINPNHVLSTCTGKELFNRIVNSNVCSDDNVKARPKSNHMRKGNVWNMLNANQRMKTRSFVHLSPDIEGYSEFLELLETVIAKHKKFVKAAKAVVNVHCPVPTGLGAMSTAVLLEKYSPVYRLYKFVRHALFFVFPEELLGGKANREILAQFVFNILGLQRQEKFSLGMLMERLRCKDFKWTQHWSNFGRRRLIAQLMIWVVRYVFLLIKSFFYVTQASAWKNRLFFYRKCIWRELHKRGIRDIMDKGIVKRIAKQDAMEMIRSGLAMGYSPLRLLPKTKSMRPIAHLGWKPKIGSLTGTSINQNLSTPYVVLRNICEEHRQCLGFGLMRLNEFPDKYADFVHRNMNKKLYYVKADIKDCYDSINTKKLLTILHQVFEKAKQSYKLKRHICIGERNQRISASFRSYIQEEGDVFFRKTAKNCSQSSILVAQDVHKPFVKIEETMKTIQSHLLFNLLYAQGSYYHQVHGISQGSLLSSLLCNIYCGSFENEFVKIDDDDLLVRQVDDYLFLTSSEDSARRFLDILLEAKGDYNLTVNPKKSNVNFDCGHLAEEKRPVVSECSVIAWCGMLIDLSSYGVSPDYWRYEGQNLDDCISAEYVFHPGYSLRRKVAHCVRIKLLKAYYDIRVNSKSNVIKNLFEVSIFAAKVFQSLTGKVFKYCRKNRNDSFLSGIVHSIPRQIERTLRNFVKDGNENVYPSLSEIEFLVYSTFVTVLKADRHSPYVVRRLEELRNAAEAKIDERRLRSFTFTVDDVENGPFGYML